MTTPFDDSSSQILVSSDALTREHKKKVRSRVKAGLLAAMGVVTVISVSTAAYFGSQHASMSAQVAELSASADEANQAAGDASSQIEELEAAVKEKDQKIASQEELLESRKGFLSALEEASALISEAKPKVSVSEFYSTVSAEQEKVLNERANPSVVTNATAAVREAMNVLSSDIQAYDKEQARIEEEKSRQDISPDDEPPPVDLSPVPTPDDSVPNEMDPSLDPDGSAD